jgi:hypothetical protein
MGVKDVSARWLKAGRVLKKEDHIYTGLLQALVHNHLRSG